MIGSVSTVRGDAMNLLRERKEEILQRAMEGEIQPKFAIGGNEYTNATWTKLLERVDATLEDVKEEQKERFERIDKEQAEQAVLRKIEERRSKVPYSYLEKDGLIEYNGVVFVCDEKHESICLGDMTDVDNVINIPLTEGGCLKVNRDNLSELSKAITMFSPADIRRIMVAIAMDTKCEQMKVQLDEINVSIGKKGNVETKIPTDDKDITTEQIALLLQDRDSEDNKENEMY